MNAWKQLSDGKRMAEQKDLTYGHFLIVVRWRKTYLQIIKNFRELEDSWPRGIKRFFDLYRPK